MIVRPAQYLLRFDDLCPTMRREGWQRCTEIMGEFALRPILAVVPDNRDPNLICAPCDPRFWKEMRGLEQAGATIAMHGYRHVCASRGRSLLGLHGTSEFAGMDLATQQKWVRDGLALLRQRGLSPRLWVAPRHGFDRNTLEALCCEGLPCLSDGFARVPFVREGVTWIPQQLWGPADKDAGLWTICIHPNTANARDLDALRTFVGRRASQFTCFEKAVALQGTGRLSMAEWIYARVALSRVQARRGRARRTGTGEDCSSSL